MKKYVVYYRVSTKDQHLGIDAQKSMVDKFLERNGGEVLDTFKEQETGTRKRFRPVLQEALNLCKDTGATLLIAKLDRLARNVHFITSLKEAGIKFIAVDMPDASDLNINILASIAQHEAEIIAKRTKDALAEINNKIRKNGSYVSRNGNVIKSLGNPQHLTDEARKKAHASNRKKRELNQNNKRALAYSKLLREKGMNYTNIARELNNNNFKTSRDKQFRAEQVKRLLVA